MNKVKSLNHLSNFSSSTRILIVGTLTPPEGVAHGYFYSSCKAKRIYRILDAALRLDEMEKDSFTWLINSLIIEPDLQRKKVIIEDINKKLSENGIAFLDTINEARRENPFSPDDRNIDPISFSDGFYKDRGGLEHRVQLYVFTSRTAEQWFKQSVDQSAITKDRSYLWNIRNGRSNDEMLIERIRAQVSAYKQETN